MFEEIKNTNKLSAPQTFSRLKMSVLLLTILISAFPILPGLSAQDYTPGVLTKDSFPTENNEYERFMIYIPHNNPTYATLPAIVFFDPMARGEVPLQLYQQLADTNKIVLISSLTIKNGPLSTNIPKIYQLMEKVFSISLLDTSKIYLAGFSGGSRLAGWFGLRNPDKVAGIIACGAGFVPEDKGYLPRIPHYAGLVGTQDMNYAEMASNKLIMDSLGIKNQLFLFEGKHSWPEPQHFERVLLSMNLLRDPVRVRNNETEIFCNFLNSGKTDAAWLTWSNAIVPEKIPCIEEFSIYGLPSAVKTNLNSEIVMLNTYLTAIATMRKAGNGAAVENIYPGWWNKKKRELKRMLDKGMIDRDMHSRIQNYMISNLYETASVEIELAKNYSSAQNFLLCLLALLPESPVVLWELYLNSERIGEIKTAIKYKDAAIKAGLSKGVDPETGLPVRAD